MEPITDTSRLCVHTMTTKNLSLGEAIGAYERAGVAGITIWRQHLDPNAVRRLGDSALKVVSLCRGGFFPADSEKGRRAAIDDNLRAIEEAKAIDAPLLVLVPGATPGIPLNVARSQIREGIEAVLPSAEAAGIRLGVEPLHPMYADDRSAINTLKQANDLVEGIDHPGIGIVLDVYHMWWDDALQMEIARAGKKIFAFHVCDWRTPTRHLLNDRAMMGEGCIPIRRIRTWVEGAGFDGMIEVEIFSDELWALEPVAYIERIKSAYLSNV